LAATAQGRAALAELRELARRADEAVLAPLAPEARASFHAALRDLVEAGNALGVAPDFRPLGKAGQAPERPPGGGARPDAPLTGPGRRVT
ncbi:MAG: hypothetical protein ACLFQL_13775, partial [Paracoccaceae bacterium]